MSPDQPRGGPLPTGGAEPFVFETAWRKPDGKLERLQTVVLTPDQVAKAGGVVAFERSLDAQRRTYARALRAAGYEGTVVVMAHRGFRRAVWPGVGLRPATVMPTVAPAGGAQSV
jgi:hypothetical protein